MTPLAGSAIDNDGLACDARATRNRSFLNHPLVCYNVLAVLKAAMRSVHGADKIEAGISLYYLADEIRRVHDGMMIAIPPAQWWPLAQLDLGGTCQLLQHLAAQMELSKFRSHPRGVKKKIPKPPYQKTKPHVSTARLLAKAKEEKKAP